MTESIDRATARFRLELEGSEQGHAFGARAPDEEVWIVRDACPDWAGTPPKEWVVDSERCPVLAVRLSELGVQPCGGEFVVDTEHPFWWGFVMGVLEAGAPDLRPGAQVGCLTRDLGDGVVDGYAIGDEFP